MRESRIAGSGREAGRRPRGRACPAGVGVLAALALGALGAACGGGDEAARSLEVRRDTVGDTVVVRNVSGSAWGDTARLAEELRIGRVEGPETYTFGRVAGLAAGPDGSIHVVDRQVPALRKYGPEGRHAADFGRPGGGPGEIGRTHSGGVALLPDGRVALRDPGNARIQLYRPDGEPAGSLPIRGSFFTSVPLVADTAGRLWHWTSGRSPSGEDRPNRYLLLDPDGGVVDTVPIPRWGKRPPRLMAERVEDGRRTMAIAAGVPFWPGDRHSVSPGGFLVGGSTAACRFELLRPSGRVLRVVRETGRAPVLPGERRTERRELEERMRRVESGWSWDGPDVPEVKPCYRDLLVGRHGRVWLLRHTEAERVEVEADDGGPGPPEREVAWREPVVFDVFAPDGRYLGAVRPEVRIDRSPPPVIRGDTVWAVTRDELDVPYVVRLRLVRPGEPREEAPAGG